MCRRDDKLLREKIKVIRNQTFTTAIIEGGMGHSSEGSAYERHIASYNSGGNDVKEIRLKLRQKSFESLCSLKLTPYTITHASKSTIPIKMLSRGLMVVH